MPVERGRVTAGTRPRSAGWWELSRWSGWGQVTGGNGLVGTPVDPPSLGRWVKPTATWWANRGVKPSTPAHPDFRQIRSGGSSGGGGARGLPGGRGAGRGGRAAQHDRSPVLRASRPRTAGPPPTRIRGRRPGRGLPVPAHLPVPHLVASLPAAATRVYSARGCGLTVTVTPRIGVAKRPTGHLSLPGRSLGVPRPDIRDINRRVGAGQHPWAPSFPHMGQRRGISG